MGTASQPIFSMAHEIVARYRDELVIEPVASEHRVVGKLLPSSMPRSYPSDASARR